MAHPIDQTGRVSEAGVLRPRMLMPLCGLVGVLILAFYFSAPLPIPAANAPEARIVDVGRRYHDTILLGAWLQGIGTALCVVFLVWLVARADASTRLAGMLAVGACALLLAVSVVEGALTDVWATGVSNGHPASAVVAFDLMGGFIHAFPVAPAPGVYLALGVVLRDSPVLPRLFSPAAFALGAGFLAAGFAAVFSDAGQIAVIVFLALQAVWIGAAAIVLLVRRGPPAASSVPG